MAQRVSRIACPRCGANNFDNVSACFKCGAPLGSVVPVASAPSVSAPVGMPPVAAASAAPQHYAPPIGRVALSGYAEGDSAAAQRAAALLGLTFPWIGLPVGWVFVMLEDPRRQAIGRSCVWWSVIGLVIHLFLMLLSVKAVVGTLAPVLQGVMQSRSAGAGGGGLEGGGMGGMNGFPGQ